MKALLVDDVTRHDANPRELNEPPSSKKPASSIASQEPSWVYALAYSGSRSSFHASRSVAASPSVGRSSPNTVIESSGKRYCTDFFSTPQSTTAAPTTPQIHGLRGETSLTRRLQYDLHYIQNWSLALDFRILFLTLFRLRATS